MLLHDDLTLLQMLERDVHSLARPLGFPDVLWGSCGHPPWAGRPALGVDFGPGGIDAAWMRIHRDDRDELATALLRYGAKRKSLVQAFPSDGDWLSRLPAPLDRPYDMRGRPPVVRQVMRDPIARTYANSFIDLIRLRRPHRPDLKPILQRLFAAWQSHEKLNPGSASSFDFSQAWVVFVAEANGDLEMSVCPKTKATFWRDQTGERVFSPWQTRRTGALPLRRRIGLFWFYATLNDPQIDAMEMLPFRRVPPFRFGRTH